MPSWTTTDLLRSIRNRQMFPDASTGSLGDLALLQYATDEIWITLVPVILGVREGYYAKVTDIDYTDATPTIGIPARYIGNTVSGVQYIYGQAISPLNPIEPIVAWTTQTSSQPSNFWFENNDIVFFPAPAGSYGTIRLRGFQRPNSLVATSACAQITAFDSLTGIATCTPPNDWTTANVFDLIPQTSNKATPFALDSTISSITTTDITFSNLSSSDSSAIRVGDWIALAGETPIPEIPVEFQPVLAQATCVRALGAINDPIALPNAKQDLQSYMSGAIKLMTPRDQMGMKKVVGNWGAL